MDNAATSRLVLLLTALIVSVALFAFFAQVPLPHGQQRSAFLTCDPVMT